MVICFATGLLILVIYFSWNANKPLLIIMVICFAIGLLIYFYQFKKNANKRRNSLENTGVINNPNRTNESQDDTPSAPPAAAAYSITDTSLEKPSEVSFNPPTYEEATMGNVYWDPSAPDTNIDERH